MVPRMLDEKLCAYMRIVRPAFGKSHYVHISVDQFLDSMTSSIGEDPADEEKDGSDDNIEQDGYQEQEASEATMQQELCPEIKKWRAQSVWLFLSFKNIKVQKPGKIWIEYMEEVSGFRSGIGV